MDIQDRTVGIQPSPLLSAACNAFTHISFDTQVPSHTDTLHRDAFAHRYFMILSHRPKFLFTAVLRTESFYTQKFFTRWCFYIHKETCTQRCLFTQQLVQTERFFLHTTFFTRWNLFIHRKSQKCCDVSTQKQYFTPRRLCPFYTQLLSSYTEKVFALMFPLKLFYRHQFLHAEFFKNTWVCLKIGYIPNEIAIFHRDNDH